MTRTWRTASIAAIGALLLLTAPVVAGGWATATITDPPDGPVAGEETSIGVEVKQHGETPISWDRLLFIGTHAESGELTVAEGRPEGPTGHYVIEVTFPREGAWEWQLQTMDLMMEPGTYPTISVAPGTAAAPQAPAAPLPGDAAPLGGAPAAAGASGVDPVLVIGIALLAFLVGAIGGTAFRRSPRSARPVTMEATSTSH